MSKSELEFVPDAVREAVVPRQSIEIFKAENKEVTKAANDDDGAWPLIEFPWGWWASP